MHIHNVRELATNLCVQAAGTAIGYSDACHARAQAVQVQFAAPDVQLPHPSLALSKDSKKCRPLPPMLPDSAVAHETLNEECCCWPMGAIERAPKTEAMCYISRSDLPPSELPGIQCTPGPRHCRHAKSLSPCCP